MTEQKTVLLITGTSKGIGKELAMYYCDCGFQVAGCSRNPAPFSKPEYIHFQIDLTAPNAAETLVRNVIDVFGRIDVLVNNAGIAAMNHIISTPAITVENVFKTNFFAPFTLIRETAKAMIRRKYGRIINFSTVAVPMNLEGEAVYASSKAALETLTRISAKELAPFGITVNTIGPAPFDSGLIRTVPSGKIANILEKQAIKQKNEISDITHVIDFFIHHDARFVTGQTIYLGGIF